MMAGAYTLSKNGHVRGDVLYGFFPPRLQAALDLTLYIVSSFPASSRSAGRATSTPANRGRSTSTRTSPPTARRSIRSRRSSRSPGSFLLIQGIVEIIRCVICLKQGHWPSREEDVEEVDVDKLKEMVHVKDEDIAKLDALVVAEGGARNEKGSLVRPVDHGGGRDHGLRADAGAVADDQRPPRAADAGADRRRHHARLSHRVHADGHGRDVRVARLPQRQNPRWRCSRRST